MDSIIVPLRKSPMENFWLEEWYTCTRYDDTNFSEDELAHDDGIPLESVVPETLRRNQFFDSNDPYFLMSDIRQFAKTILKNEE